MFHAPACATTKSAGDRSRTARAAIRTNGARSDPIVDHPCPAVGNQALLRMAAGNRSADTRRGRTTAPAVVHEVLRSPGAPLDQETRAFMEPRFGHDFADVRLHTGQRAAKSAEAVNALAYTVGRDVVLGTGHDMRSPAGRELLAHELAHVVQQGHAGYAEIPLRISQPTEPSELHAEQMAQSALAGGRPVSPRSQSDLGPAVSRRVIPGRVECTAHTDGAPADPVAELTRIVASAELLARLSATLLAFTAMEERAGIRNTTGPVSMAFDDRFGPPAPVRGGFLNRLTGTVRPTEGIALSEEMDLMAARFTLIANLLASDFNHYRCIGGATSWRGIRAPDCSRDAWTFPGIDAYLLCPGFWATDLTSSTLLIHETSHIIWEQVFHGAPGSGGNFHHAECYASFVADLFGVAPAVAPGDCPLP
jgi:hypothetical protein